MDDELRSLERRWRAGEPGALEALAHAHDRAGVPVPWDAVVALPRWSLLGDFAARWCGRPLSPEDGQTETAVVRKEGELGVRLPSSLREWYRLVGASLRPSYDLPTKLEDLALRPDSDGVAHMVIFEEMHGHYEWAVGRPQFSSADPPVLGSHDCEPFEHFAEHLSAFLAAKVIEGATFGATTDEREAPIGELGAHVQGTALGWRLEHQQPLVR